MNLYSSRGLFQIHYVCRQARLRHPIVESFNGRIYQTGGRTDRRTGALDTSAWFTGRQLAAVDDVLVNVGQLSAAALQYICIIDRYVWRRRPVINEYIMLIAARLLSLK